ncbi:MAG: ATP-binding protein [Alphaproteobacteria bacterium]|nr:ATP-binding protein [Alphaproteobacteria bacterium]
MSEENKKHNPVALGVPGRPYPMMMSASSIKDGDDNVFLEPELGVLEKPLVFTSKRPYAEIVGPAYRDMPSPSMLRTFYNALDLRSEQSDRKVQAIFGPPGTGKSFLPKTIAKMRDERGAIVVDCGGMNLEELLFETVLDMDRSKDVYEKIDKRIAKGELQHVSMKILKEGLGSAYSEDEDGKAAIDWASVGKQSAEEQAEGDKDESLDKAVAAIKEVAELENLNTSDSGGVSLKTQHGPIIKAWEEGRELILDEYNKSKEGTEGQMQILWQLFIGEEKEHKVTGGAGLEYTFKKKDMPAGFFVTVTGNESDDGTSTHGLSESVYSRLQPEFLTVPTEKDWQHRICQTICNVPVSTIFDSADNQWGNDVGGFAKTLKTFQKLGMSEQKKMNVPEWQTKMLDNWQDVMEASEKLSKFYMEWSKLVDPDNENLPADLTMEVDEEYKAQVGVGMRLMMKHINKAVRSMPETVSIDESKGYSMSTDWESAPDFTHSEQSAGEAFGSNLCQVIIDDIEKTTTLRGKPELFKALMETAAKYGIAEANLSEGSVSEENMTIADLLGKKDDASLEEQIYGKEKEELHTTNKEVDIIQKMVCDKIRKLDSEISDNDDDIVTSAEIKGCLDSLMEDKKDNETKRDKFIIIPNPNFMDDTSDAAKPFVLVPTADALPETPEDLSSGTSGANPDNGELLGYNDLLEALSIPEIGDRNLSYMMNQAITNAIPDMTSSVLESVAIAQGESKSGLSATTIVCANEEKSEQVTMRILSKTSEEGSKTVIAGNTSIDDEIKEKLDEVSITYVNINEDSGWQKVNMAVTQIVGSNSSQEHLDAVKDAMGFRNQPLDDASSDEYSSVDKIMATKQPSTAPVYLLKNKLQDR